MRFATAASCLFFLFTSIISASPKSADPQSTNVATPPASLIPQKGQTAPSFALPSQSGKTEALEHFRGKWVVLYFYPEDMTAGCTLEAHGFQRDAEKFQKRNAVVIGVSVDSVDSHKRFCAKEKLNIKLLSDVELKVVAQYGSLNPISRMANRNTFLIDPNGKIAKVWMKVAPPHHSEEVLSVIDAQQHS